MTLDVPVLEAPPPELLYRRRVSLVTAVKDMWKAREITRSLAERDIRSRYKQAVLGFAWAIVTPLILVVAFTIFMKRVTHTDTGGVPPALFTFVGLIPWMFFSGSLGNAVNSLVGNINLINKVPCPREVFPLAGVAESAFDSSLSLVMLGALFAILTFMPKPTTVWVPAITIVLIAFVIACSVMLAVAVVYVRDLRSALPLALQFGVFVTPVAYGFNTLVPPWARGIYAVLNPLGPIIDSYRRTVLYGQSPDFLYMGLATLSTALLLFGGYWLFKRMEAGIADVA
jgi:ABC-2 type transport system permease protein/lipopolysaccharide transport system permease protein